MVLRFVAMLTISAGSLWAQVPNRFEVVPVDERQEIAKLAAMIQSRITTVRDAHPKAHGCIDDVKVKILDAELLPTHLRYGYFATPGKEYQAVIRLSSGSSDAKAVDASGGVHGFALKILLDEEDQKSLIPLYGEERIFVDSKYYKSFDIVTISHLKEFMVETVADYMPFFAAQGAAQKALRDALAQGQGIAIARAAAAEQLKNIYLFPTQGKQRPREAQLIAAMNQAQSKQLLTETYGSWVPSLLGEQAIKYQIRPCFAKPDSGVVDPSDANFLRTHLKVALTDSEQCFRLAVQVYQDGFPSIEDPVASWNESLSPYLDVATITIPQKQSGNELMDDAICERASFHPGHASAEHFPIGGIQRARIGGQDYSGIYTIIHNARNRNASR
jgi:hypothetical protein